MIAEIHGANFINKGAELMLRSVIANLAADPGMRFAVYPQAYGAYEDRARLGLYQLLPGGGRGSLTFAALARLGPMVVGNRLARAYEHWGLLPLKAVDALIDVSGFRFSDQWGTQPTMRFARLVKDYADRGKPIILLPQSFGPFTSPRIRACVRRIVDASALVFARDEISLAYILDVTGPSNLVRLAPDITISFGGEPPRDSPPDSPLVAVVPNARMLDKGGQLWRDSYVDMLAGASSSASRQGAEVILMAHSTEAGDRSIVSELASRLKTPTSVLETNDPVELKQRISRCSFVIASRFHAVVSSLSMGIPAITLGWSHKYRALLEDFRVEDLMVEVSEGAQFDRLIDRLLQSDENSAIRETLIRQRRRLQKGNEEMWSAVRAALRSAGP